MDITKENIVIIKGDKYYYDEITKNYINVRNIENKENKIKTLIQNNFLSYYDKMLNIGGITYFYNPNDINLNEFIKEENKTIMEMIEEDCKSVREDIRLGIKTDIVFSVCKTPAIDDNGHLIQTIMIF